MTSLTLLLVLLLPLVGGLVGLLNVKNNRWFGLLGTFGAWIISMILLIGFGDSKLISWSWLPGFELSILIDQVSLLLASLVLFVSLLVQLFSTEYLKDEPGITRYFAKLGLFISSMLGLLFADNLLLLFVFWELVGLSSYLLIGFWYRKEGVPKSAKTAFMVNRVADAALLAGILMLYDETELLSISSFGTTASLLASLLIVIGSFGKSAQLPFSGWLIKAMVGPTPVSALIHAATMVAAGVYLLFRVTPVLHADAFILLAFGGAFTAFYAAISAITQFDIKKVLAYSTISQLGYMVTGIGVGAREASLFHLFTHAFFKAGLFLGAAAIIHYLHAHSTHDPQDMRRMGGLSKKLPWIFRTFLICGMALAGLPLFSGFMSKDGILLGAWSFASEVGSWAYIIPDMALITALLTAFYVGRMILLVFFGNERFQNSVSIKESGAFKIPLMVLSAFSLWVFHHWNPFSHDSQIFETLRISGLHVSGGELIPFLSAILAIGGLALAYSFFKPGTEYMDGITELREPYSVAGSFVYEGLKLNHFYQQAGVYVVGIAKALSWVDQMLIDAVIHFVAVASVVLSKVLALVERFLVDGPVNLVAMLSVHLGKRLSGFSSRDGQTQIIWLLLILILILLSIVLF